MNGYQAERTAAIEAAFPSFKCGVCGGGGLNDSQEKSRLTCWGCWRWFEKEEFGAQARRLHRTVFRQCTCCDGENHAAWESAKPVSLPGGHVQTLCLACAMVVGGSRPEYEVAGHEVLAHIDDEKEEES